MVLLLNPPLTHGQLTLGSYRQCYGYYREQYSLNTRHCPAAEGGGINRCSHVQ